MNRRLSFVIGLVLAAIPLCPAARAQGCQTFTPNPATFPFFSTLGGALYQTNFTVTQPNGTVQTFTQTAPLPTSGPGAIMWDNPSNYAASVFGSQASALFQSCNGVFPSAAPKSVTITTTDGAFSVNNTVSSSAGVLSITAQGTIIVTNLNGSCPDTCLLDQGGFTQTYVYDIQHGSYTIHATSFQHTTFIDSNGVTTDAIDTFNGSASGTWAVTQTSLCDSGTSVSNVLLPSVTVSPKISIKPWQITYAPLNLNFAITQSSVSCDAQSNSGTLGVFFSGVQIADSITSAKLSVFQPGVANSIENCQFTLFNSVSNNCLLNGVFDSGASYVRWSSPGFNTVPFPTYQTLVPGPGTGPLTFWVDLDALGLSASSNSMDAIVRAAEPFIHQTLIDNLPFFAWYTVIQDPGSVGILVVNSKGLTSGTLPNGKSTLDIPQSFLYSSASNPAVILQDPPDGSYQVILSGLHDGGYELSVSATSINHLSSQQVINGSILQGKTIAYQLNLSTSNIGQTQSVNLGTVVPGDLNGDERPDCSDLAAVKASFGKKAGQQGFNAWADVNGDGIVNILDLSIVAKQLPAGTVCQ